MRAFRLPAEVLERDPAQRHEAHAAGGRGLDGGLTARPRPIGSFYELAEKTGRPGGLFPPLALQSRHHRGTGDRLQARAPAGPAGVSYLKRMLEVELFPELWHLRTDL